MAASRQIWRIPKLYPLLDGAKSSTLVSSVESVASAVQAATEPPPPGKPRPSLNVDVRAADLSRHGSISFVNLYVTPKRHVYLVDVQALQAAAFDTPAADGTTLRSILEDPTLTKVFYDVRGPADALYAHFGLRLHRIRDVQLMENAARPCGQRRHLNSIDTAFECDARAPHPYIRAWRAAREKALPLLDPDRGGSSEAVDRRPLDPALRQLFVNEVVVLADLRRRYMEHLGPERRAKVAEEMKKRVEEAQSEDYDTTLAGQGHLGPWERPGEPRVEF